MDGSGLRFPSGAVGSRRRRAVTPAPYCRPARPRSGPGNLQPRPHRRLRHRRHGYTSLVLAPAALYRGCLGRATPPAMPPMWTTTAASLERCTRKAGQRSRPSGRAATTSTTPRPKLVATATSGDGDLVGDSGRPHPNVAFVRRFGVDTQPRFLPRLDNATRGRTEAQDVIRGATPLSPDGGVTVIGSSGGGRNLHATAWTCAYQQAQPESH
jgi:hypothetical protein